MTDQTITVEQIQGTKTFESLNSTQQSFSLKRANRMIITNGLVVHRNTDVIPANIQGYNVGILNDLIISESAKNSQSL